MGITHLQAEQAHWRIAHVTWGDVARDVLALEATSLGAHMDCASRFFTTPDNVVECH